jgi:hypothetical protein
MDRKNMSLAYLNTYVHQGEVQYSAVFVGGSQRREVWRHGMDAREYQDAFDDYTGKGFGLRLITGAGTGSASTFAAVWAQ